MSNFLSSITDKAQNALKSAGFSQTAAGEGDDGRAGGILKSHAVESIHHQLRSLQQQYSGSVSPVQKIITTQKGVALDLDGLASDSQAYSKELYQWGQREDPDIKDVTDRLGWISFTEGSLARAYAAKIDQSRAPFKALRDAETTLFGRRNIRAALHNQIVRLEREPHRGNEQKLAELKQQLQQAEQNDDPLEKEYELLKRKAVRDGEQIKWQATREYAEKLLLLSQAASAVLTALPSVPPADKQYHGAETTTSVRASLQHALDNYKPGDINLPLNTSPPDLQRSDTRSFGETHAHELARIQSGGSAVSIPLTPPASSAGNALPPPAPSHASQSGVSYMTPTSETGSPPSLPARTSSIASPPPIGTQSPPLNPAALNQSPAPIPVSSSISPSPLVAPDPADTSVKIPSVTPTVAETGVPKSAGSDGPGPSSGNLRDLKAPSPVATRSPLTGQDTQGRYGTDALPSYGTAGPSEASGAAPEKYESAEDEKKRLAREERERVLVGESQPAPQPEDGDVELPPYKELE